MGGTSGADNKGGIFRMLIEELAAMYSTVPSIFQRIVIITIIYNNNDNGDNGTAPSGR